VRRGSCFTSEPTDRPTGGADVDAGEAAGPREHGYGGTKQDYPAGDEPDTTGEPSEDADDGEDPREAPDPDQN